MEDEPFDFKLGVDALKEIATKYEFHHLEEYVTHLQVVYGHPDPYEEMKLGEVQETFLQICTGAGLHIATVLAGLENVYVFAIAAGYGLGRLDAIQVGISAYVVGVFAFVIVTTLRKAHALGPKPPAQEAADA